MKHLGTVTLETPRLILRRFTKEDAVAVWENWGADPEVYRYMTTKIMPKLSDVEEFLDKKIKAYKRPETYYWAIVPKDPSEGGRPIGMVTLTGTSPTCETAHLAYSLGRKWWGKGYAREASAAVLQFAFEQVGLGLVYGSHFVPNRRSSKVLLSLGMRHVGKRRSPFMFRKIHPFCEEYMLPAELYFAEKEKGLYAAMQA